MTTFPARRRSTPEQIGLLLAGYQFTYANEDELQRGIAAALEREGFEVERELRLSSRDRVDVFVAGGVGIEVKVAGTIDAAVRQLRRYAEHDGIAGLLLVTDRVRHLRAPRELNGKPVAVLTLTEQGL